MRGWGVRTCVSGNAISDSAHSVLECYFLECTRFMGCFTPDHALRARSESEFRKWCSRRSPGFLTVCVGLLCFSLMFQFSRRRVQSHMAGVMRNLSGAESHALFSSFTSLIRPERVFPYTPRALRCHTSLQLRYVFVAFRSKVASSIFACHRLHLTVASSPLLHVLSFSCARG